MNKIIICKEIDEVGIDKNISGACQAINLDQVRTRNTYSLQKTHRRRTAAHNIIKYPDTHYY